MQKERITIKAKDGALISALACNRNEPSVRGLVLICHGFGEHSGSYHELMERLAAAGYASLIFDQRGHGELSEPDHKKRKKRLGVIPGYQSFLDDIDDVTAEIRRRLPNVPLALYGHSMGGNIAANYLLSRAQDDFSCVILESPWFGLTNSPNSFVIGLAKVLGTLSPKFAIYNKLTHTDITADEKQVGKIASDPLYHNRISMRMFAGIHKGCRYAVENAARLSVPTLLAYAGGERIVSNPAIAAFHSACGPHVIAREYPSCHAIHNDSAKEKLYADIISFLNAHCLPEGLK
ncbi:MAG: lysophospholipase [Clostridiales bacterium]|nr:lysophospholipase [Clostridiales bacterium]